MTSAPLEDISETTLPKHWMDQDSDATTSADEAPARSGTVSRQLRAKQTRREKMVSSVDTGPLSFLEWSAIANPAPYEQVLKEWLRHAAQARHLRLVEDDEVDASLTHWANDSFLVGNGANKGEKLLASVMHQLPQFGKFGSRKLPRFHRALKGWRRRTPPRSRNPHSWPIWAMIIWEFCRAGEWLMGLYTFFMVAGYFRPS